MGLNAGEVNVQIKKQAPRANLNRCAYGRLAGRNACVAACRRRTTAVLTLLVMWHVVYGNHGLSIWQQKRAEDALNWHEIKDLQQENAQMRQRIDHLNSNPDAIEREAL